MAVATTLVINMFPPEGSHPTPPGFGVTQAGHSKAADGARKNRPCWLTPQAPAGSWGQEEKKWQLAITHLHLLRRGGDQQGAKAGPPSQQGNGPHLPEGSRAARDSVGWAGRCRPQVYHRVVQTSSLFPLARDAEPRGGCSSQTT